MKANIMLLPEQYSWFGKIREWPDERFDALQRFLEITRVRHLVLCGVQSTTRPFEPQAAQAWNVTEHYITEITEIEHE